MENSPPKVLVVEDDCLIAEWIKLELEQRRFKVVGPLAFLDQAFEAVQNKALDGALLDVNLGSEGTSFSIAAALRARKVPFLFVTAYDETIPAEFHSVPRLPKPIDFKILAALMRRQFTVTPHQSPTEAT